MGVLRYFHRFFFLFVICGLIGAWASASRAQEGDLQVRINEQISILTGQGYQYSAGGIIESAARDDTKTIPVQMKTGPTYALVAVCSASCSHVELTVRDANGAELVKSPEAGPVVMVGGGLPADGAYEIQITAKQCSTPTCGIAFAILEHAPPPATLQNPDATVAVPPPQVPSATRDAAAEILESIISQLPSLIITTVEAERIRKQTKAEIATTPVATEASSAPGKPTGYRAQPAPKQPSPTEPTASAQQRAGASQARCQQVQQQYYAAVRTSGDPASIQNVIQLYAFLQCNCGFPRSPHVTQC